jgi:hypothetical protein
MAPTLIANSLLLPIDTSSVVVEQYILIVVFAVTETTSTKENGTNPADCPKKTAADALGGTKIAQNPLEAPPL